MRKNYGALIFFFAVLLMFAGSNYWIFDNLKEIDEMDEKRNQDYYVDGVYKDPNVIEVEIAPFKNLFPNEVAEEVKKQAEELSAGSYVINDTLVIVPPQGTAYRILSVQPTKYEVYVMVAKTIGESSPVYGELIMSESFPIGVYNEEGELLY